MSAAVQINITKDNATPAIKRVVDNLRRPQVRQIIGYEAAEAHREHLYTLHNTRPNRLGGERTGYYKQAADRTHWKIIKDGAIVSINQRGISQRYHGGRIVPIVRKFLSIPFTAEAHGTRPIDSKWAGKLQVLYGRRGPYALALRKPKVVAVSGKAKAVKGSRPQPVFLLVEEVNQAPDPTVIPTSDSVLNRVIKAVIRYLEIRG